MDSDEELFCTFNPDAPCESCINHNEIFCKPDPNKVIVSHMLEFSFITMAVFGIVVTSWILNFWWISIFFILFLPIFFFILQARLTCSHCPYYTESRRMLHCTENHFTPKLWRFHPEPIAQWEQIGTILCFIFLGGFPLIVELYALWMIIQLGGNILSIVSFSGIILGTVLTLLLFYLTFYMLYCPHCINFSCVFNRVPRQYVDEYIRRNPSMQRAWKKFMRKKT